MLGLDEGVETSRVLGLVIVKGSQVNISLSRFKVFALKMAMK